MNRWVRLLGMILLVTWASWLSAHDPNLEALLAVPEQGPVPAEAAEAWQTVSAWPVGRLVEILDAADQAHPVALNWLRSAIEGLIERPSVALSSEELERVAGDARRKFASRRIALELLESIEPKRAESLAATFLEDPIAAFRRPAIERLLKQADALKDSPNEQRAIYEKAFHAARDEDQVLAAAKGLTDLGQKPDVPRHFGYLLEWHVVGPFDHTDDVGFEKAYPPESLTLDDFDASEAPRTDLSYMGKSGEVRWQKQQAAPETGEVDLNQSLGKLKEVVGYGTTIYQSPREQDVQLRLRLQNSHKIWLNGELLRSQAVGHTGNSFDQYTIPVRLKAGPNLILVKSCQSKPPQPMDFFDTWHISVRVCDEAGTAILENE